MSQHSAAHALRIFKLAVLILDVKIVLMILSVWTIFMTKQSLELQLKMLSINCLLPTNW